MSDDDEPTGTFAFERESKRVVAQASHFMAELKIGNAEADSVIASCVIESVMEIWRVTNADEKKARATKR